ncbi:MAG: IPExxxVDY family protein [Bacteroidota bacterium]|nr:IPExxxVDY family protein [Bacteroidota bacterium]
MGKHTLEIEYDYDFVLIGISSHEKDYRICWALNNKFGIELVKAESLEIKGKKQETPSFFSLFTFEDAEAFTDYAVVANRSETKLSAEKEHSLFGTSESKRDDQNEILVPEHKQMNYFFVIKGELEEEAISELLKKIKELEIVLTAIRIDVSQMKSKHNLIF